MGRIYFIWGIGGIFTEEVNEGTARAKQKGLEVQELFGKNMAVRVI